MTNLRNGLSNEKRLSLLLGSINPYSYLGHSQRMFCLAHSFFDLGANVTWANSPGSVYWKNRKFVTNSASRRLLFPFFSLTVDNVNEAVAVPVFDFWASPKYDKLSASLYFTRFLQRLYSFIFSRAKKFDVFLFDSPVLVDFALALKKVQNTLIIYHSPDDYFAYSEVSESFKRLEADIVNVADLIITPTESIRKNILKRNNCSLDVRVIPNGVPKAALADAPVIKTKNTISRIGFIGTLASWVDVDLIFQIALKMPYCEFVIVGDGPNYNAYKQFAPSNCKFVGRVPIAKRNEVISSFDVGLIPFKLIPIADSSFPLKLLEYFARGIPVVSSPLVEVKNIASGLVYFADKLDEWVDQINTALTNSYETRLSYIKFASKYTWECNAQRLLKLMSELKASIEKP
jgi:glycosyltransferase involved in cell wall biosynthesis